VEVVSYLITQFLVCNRQRWDQTPAEIRPFHLLCSLETSPCLPSCAWCRFVFCDLLAFQGIRIWIHFEY
jgi:hypothetical protein